MGKDDVQKIGEPRAAVDDRPDLPPLHKAIKSLKDKCYGVVRYAYLKEWDYYVLETKEFKMSVRKARDPALYKYLEDHKLKDELFWICVEGMDYYPIFNNQSCKWGTSDGEKSAQYWLEGEAIDRKLPENEPPDENDVDPQNIPF